MMKESLLPGQAAEISIVEWINEKKVNIMDIV